MDVIWSTICLSSTVEALVSGALGKQKQSWLLKRMCQYRVCVSQGVSKNGVLSRWPLVELSGYESVR